MQLKIKRVPSDQGRVPPLPAPATAGSAALDLQANIDESVVLMPGARRRIPTGVSIALPADGWAAFVFARSGLADREGICLANGVGVIDADYRGEIQVRLVNHSSRAAVIEPGQRIAQLAVMPVERVEVIACEQLDETGRGAGGFGSTGR